ncbi:MAG: hypothetical protein MJZ34_16515 [Paludibacteraceae bacterium]|nr:hypothetical protein [Paludibacteraceae bacterium]
MDNSQTYKLFLEQINATGSKKKDGYYPNIMEEIYDWEREQVEDILWSKFVVENEVDLAIFMPKLVKYDGVAALKTKMREFVVPSEGSYNIAEALYIMTNESEYLRVMLENYHTINEKSTKIGFVSRLSRLAKKQEVYDILIDIYKNDEENINQTTAIVGVLWADGYLQSVDDMDEMIKKLQLIQMFKKDSTDERKHMIANYKEGQFEHYKMEG